MRQNTGEAHTHTHTQRRPRGRRGVGRYLEHGVRAQVRGCAGERVRCRVCMHVCARVCVCDLRACGLVGMEVGLTSEFHDKASALLDALHRGAGRGADLRRDVELPFVSCDAPPGLTP